MDAAATPAGRPIDPAAAHPGALADHGPSGTARAAGMTLPGGLPVNLTAVHRPVDRGAPSLRLVTSFNACANHGTVHEALPRPIAAVRD